MRRSKGIPEDTWRCKERPIFIKSNTSQSHVASSDGRDLSRFQDRGAPRGHTVIIRSPSDGHDSPRSSSHLGDAWTSMKRPIVIRWVTRGALWRVRSSSYIGKIKTRSRRDRGPIVARSWPRLKRNQGQFTANSGATTSSIETASTTPSNRTHDRIKWP